ncbi:NACHT domain-containing NTPase [Chromobacterium sp.]|uniref:NACHT domain-containing protein n=1 Tax=Chromobacterium sp. TaxID=306190 RepID=UPI0035B293B2
MNSSWALLENYVRNIAQTIWQRPVKKDRIDGVNFDGVIHISEEEVILLEITEEFSLEKIRSDVSKIAAIKLKFATQSVLARAFIIISKEPTQGMIDIGKAHKIQVVSINTFSQQAFNFLSYKTIRLDGTFGSAIDPISGKPDTNDFIPVTYLINGEEKSVSVQDICEKLSKRNRLILLGEYGTGKSRCVREAFQILAKTYRNASAYPIAISLREHWGALSGIEIIAGHFQRLGLSNSIDQVMQLLRSGSILLLLDGFDEVGTQTFGNSEGKRQSIRKHALSGVRDLLSISKGGALITGRPHYFNDDEELLEALGLSLRQTSHAIIRCRDEFETEQANTYLTALGLSLSAPKWLPKKPLMFQILATIPSTDAENILKSDSGEVGFWGQFIDTVCAREAKMHTSIEASTVRTVLANLAKLTRLSQRNLGRLTPRDVNHAYEQATGYAPDESGQLMLSRLCTLGRIEPESPDRQFVDPYIVQLLFAEGVIEDISNKNHDDLNIPYNQALEPLGLYFLAQWIDTYNFEQETLAFIYREGNAKNTQLIGEVICSLLLIEGEPINFSGISLVGCEIYILSFGARKFSNILFSDCIIHHSAFENCLIDPESFVTIKNSEIIKATGLSSSSGLPTWIQNCKLSSTDNVSTSSRIKSSQLPPSQKLFLSIIHKIFFQRGGGRKENSLYKGGFGQNFDKKIIDKILTILISEGLIEKSKDNSGFIYNPKREYTSRMKAIKDQLALSKDPLWIKMENLN